MKRNKFKLALFISMSIFLSGFTSFYLNNDTNSLKDNIVQNLDSFSEGLKLSAWNWTTTEVVSTESSDYSGFSTLAIDNSGNVHIAWYDLTNFFGSGIDRDIFYKRWDVTTAAWTLTEVVSTESNLDSYYPTLAVDSYGNVHIAWEDWTNYSNAGLDFDIFYKYWNATTATWSTTTVVSNESSGSSQESTIAVDDSGNVHIAWEEGWDINYKLWNATTAVWTTSESISTETTFSYNPTIAVDGSGNVYIAWEDTTNYDLSGEDSDIFYKLWNTTTAAWTTTEVISTESTTHSYNPGIAVDPSGNVHIAWDDLTDYDFAGTDYDIFYKHWNATTATWTTTEVVSTESTSGSNYPTITVDGFGNVHITWEDTTDYDFAGTDWDIFYKLWNASTATWTTTEVISTEGATFSRYPDITTDSFGNVHIAWHDNLNYDGSGSDSDIFYEKFKISIVINDGDASTASTLVTLTLLAHLAEEMCFRNGTGGTWSSWEAYNTTRQVYLEGSVHNTVYTIQVKYRNALGETSPVADNIRYLSLIPSNPSIIINNGDTSTDSTLVTLTLSADAAEEMCFRNGTGGIWSSWEAFSTTKQVYLEGSVHNMVYTIQVKYRNIIGETSPIGDSILYVNSIPLNPSIIINNGNANTNSPLVNLTLLADGATEMCFRNGTGGLWTSWEVYNTTKQVYLEGSVHNTVYTIQVKYRNIIGETSPVGDSILYVNSIPLNPSIIINNGDPSTNITLVTLTLSADGVTEMCFRNGTGGLWTSWEVYSTTKQVYLEGSVHNTVYTIQVKYRNVIGETSPIGDSILYIIFPPSNPSIIINNGDVTTNSTLMTLTLSVDLAEEMCFRNGTDGIWSSWEVYSTTKQVYLEGSVNNTVYTIQVKFRNIIGETSPVGDSILYLLLSVPLNPSIIINNGDASTNSTLVTLTLSADYAEEMCFRNGTDGIWSSWEVYSTTKQVYLEGSVNNTIYTIQVKFRNIIGEISPVGDSIRYLVFPPLNPSIVINNGDTSTNSTLVTLTLSAEGVEEMCFRNGTDGIWSSWEVYSTIKQVYLEGSLNNTAYIVQVKYRNSFGETSPVGDSILYIIIPPLNPSIIINNGDASTDSTLVTLTLSADGATEMCFRNGTDGIWSSWEAYSTTKLVYLEGSVNNTAYTIQVKYRNAFGETSPVGDSILYLIFPPLNPSIIINNGDASTDSTLVTLTLSADGATEMCFRNGTSGTWTSWEAYNTTKQVYLAGSLHNTEYRIQVMFRNVFGETPPVEDSILYLITAEEKQAPSIPGYPVGWIIISLLAGIGIIAINNKSKRIKLINKFPTNKFEF